MSVPNRAALVGPNGNRRWLAEIAHEDVELLARALRIAACELGTARDEEAPAMISLHDDVHTESQRRRASPERAPRAHEAFEVHVHGTDPPNYDPAGIASPSQARVPLESIAFAADRAEERAYHFRQGDEFISLRADQWRLLRDLIRISQIAADRSEAGRP